MGIHVADQTITFLCACLLGAALGVFYDVFRILRVAFPTGKGVVFVQDILFFAVGAVVSFLFLLTASDGVVRFFLLVGEGIGWVLYYCTLGRLVMRVAGALIDAVKAVLRFLHRFLLRPVWRVLYAAVSLLCRPALFLAGVGKKTWQRQKIRLKVHRIVLYNHCKDPARRRAGSISAVSGESRHGLFSQKKKKIQSRGRVALYCACVYLSL